MASRYIANSFMYILKLCQTSEEAKTVTANSCSVFKLICYFIIIIIIIIISLFAHKTHDKMILQTSRWTGHTRALTTALVNITVPYWYNTRWKKNTTHESTNAVNITNQTHYKRTQLTHIKTLIHSWCPNTIDKISFYDTQKWLIWANNK